MSRVVTLKAHEIWVNEEVIVAWTGMSASKSRAQKVEWDPAKTEITRAEIYCKIRIPSTQCGGKVLMNGEEVFAAVNGLTSDGTKDVTTILRNGLNSFEIILEKKWYFIYEVRAYYDVILTIEFSGEEPVVTPPEVWPFEWWLIAAIVGGAALITVIGIVAYQERKRTEEFMILMARR